MRWCVRSFRILFWLRYWRPPLLVSFVLVPMPNAEQKFTVPTRHQMQFSQLVAFARLPALPSCHMCLLSLSLSLSIAIAFGVDVDVDFETVLSCKRAIGIVSLRLRETSLKQTKQKVQILHEKFNKRLTLTYFQAKSDKWSCSRSSAAANACISLNIINFLNQYRATSKIELCIFRYGNCNKLLA